MIWAICCITALLLSALSSVIVFVKLWKDCNVRPSSVRWLFAIFFTYQSILFATRLVYFIWLTIAILGRKLCSDYTNLQNESVMRTELYRMGTSAVLKSTQRKTGWITALIIIGDTSLFGLTIWVAALAYELSRLVMFSMDRGEKHERAKIRLYQWIGHSSIAIFLIVEIVLASVCSGYSKYAYSLLLAVYIVQIIVLIYMVIMVIVLKVNGRKYESVHGHFVTSPLYLRLKWIMFVYMFFAFQFQFSSVILYAMPSARKHMSNYAGISFALFYLRGFILSLVAGGSQSCVVRCCSWCIPEEIKAQYALPCDCVILMPDAECWDLPYINPVFVITDIESSSALWALDNCRVMQQATRIHDDILRRLLATYRGYEIATAGDSFQLAFHTIREAVEYCLDVQLQLLKAKWPKNLHGLIPATRKERVGLTTIFRGLRVRMGVHDAVGSEGSLIRDVHVVTGRLTYTGASEVIANEIGDLGAGGQILITKRVAEWLAANSSQMITEFVMKAVCEYSIPRLNTKLEVYQVLPKVLAMRCESFRLPQHIVQIEPEEAQYRTESSAFYSFMQLSRYVG